MSKITDLSSFSFGTKAETLSKLKPLVKSSVIPDIYYFSVMQWVSERRAVVDAIVEKFNSELLAIRSSAITEDGADSSMAGAYLSKLNVICNDRSDLEGAIDQVVLSMTGNPHDQVLIQPMVSDVDVSGVIMTFDLQHGSPYYCIDFDEESGLTDTVTGGNGVHKSLFVYRHAEDNLIRSPRVASFLRLARELELHTGCTALDIEFAMSKSGQMYLVQARRIVAASNWHPVTERRVKRQLAFVERFIKDRSKSRDGVLGDRTILAVMSDWNPAEIIGTSPRILSSSLYRYLITDSVWRDARAKMGYRELPGVDLMVLINNHPYIDVRNSFNSFLPAKLPVAIGEKLVNAWLGRLERYPELHDKVEFEIVPTCLDFCFDQSFEDRYQNVLDAGELSIFRNILTQLTLHCITGDTLDQALEDSTQLERHSYSDINCYDPYEQLSIANLLLTQCKKLGTLPFAIVARHAFIAEALMRSAVVRGALTEKRLNEFRRSIRTVTGNMVLEYSEASQNRDKRNKFLKEYGHLRPGTYEITSLRYDERDDLFSSDINNELPSLMINDFVLSDVEYNAINTLLNKVGLNTIDPNMLLRYACKSISARERVKFIFTKVLSDALSAIVRWGDCHGLSRNDLSYLQWSDIVMSLTQPVMDDVDRYYLALAENGRGNISSADAFKLAHIIYGVRDIYVATLNRSTPNFVGIGSAAGKVIFLDANSSASTNIKNLIVCIENADPGFDWIFIRQPCALITQFGGANSHMAIRCAELGLPAAIGCGEQLFQRVLSAGRVDLNCDQKIVRPLYGN